MQGDCMIKGSKIILKLIESQEELLEKIELQNRLEDRALTDHTELVSLNKAIKAFNDHGFWQTESGTMLITDLEGHLIGDIGYKKSTDMELQIGYRMLSETARGKGYMTEALNLFSVYLFETIPLITRLSLLTAEDNIPSRKLAEKCGFVQEGILRNAYFYRGKICDWVIYGLLREEISN